jgi:uncharacterized membrane protein
MRKSEAIALTIVVVSFVTAVYFYYQLPETIVSHWNFYGQPDGYTSKLFGLFLIPFLLLGLLMLFMVLPKIDPFKESYKKFRKYYDMFVVLIITMLFYLYVLTIVWNLGFMFDLIQFLSPAFGLIFYYAGIMTENAKRNWFVGFRTPWTMSSEKVWNKTNRLGGKLFKIGGFVALFGIVFSMYALILSLALLVLFSFYTFIYSYFEYKKEKK